jgi:regulator of replication initiation timing
MTDRLHDDRNMNEMIDTLERELAAKDGEMRVIRETLLSVRKDRMALEAENRKLRELLEHACTLSAVNMKPAFSPTCDLCAAIRKELEAEP